MEKFKEAVEEGDEETVKVLLDESPELAKAVMNRSGDTALHFICTPNRKSSKPSIAFAILNSCPSVLGVQNKQGLTPFQKLLFFPGALKFFDFFPFVREVMRANPACLRISDPKLGALPIHMMCLCTDFPSYSVVKEMLRLYPESAKAVTKKGNLPIHCAAMYQGMEWSTFSLLANAYPESLSTKNKDQRTPLDYQEFTDDNMKRYFWRHAVSFLEPTPPGIEHPLTRYLRSHRVPKWQCNMLTRNMVLFNEKLTDAKEEQNQLKSKLKASSRRRKELDKDLVSLDEISSLEDTLKLLEGVIPVDLMLKNENVDSFSLEDVMQVVYLWKLLLEIKQKSLFSGFDEEIGYDHIMANPNATKQEVVQFLGLLHQRIEEGSDDGVRSTDCTISSNEESKKEKYSTRADTYSDRGNSPCPSEEVALELLDNALDTLRDASHRNGRWEGISKSRYNALCSMMYDCQRTLVNVNKENRALEARLAKSNNWIDELLSLKERRADLEDAQSVSLLVLTKILGSRDFECLATFDHLKKLTVYLKRSLDIRSSNQDPMEDTLFAEMMSDPNLASFHLAACADMLFEKNIIATLSSFDEKSPNGEMGLSRKRRSSPRLHQSKKQHVLEG